MRYSISIILISFCITVCAQTPGYMGKRFVAGYGLYASPGYIGSAGTKPVNILHEGFVEYAIKKRISIGLSARFYKNIYANTRDVDLGRYNSNFTQIDKNPTGITNIRGRNYMLYFKFFKSRYLAPWGRYFILGATLNTFTASYDPDHMSVSVLSSPYSYSSSGSATYSLYSDFGPTAQTFKKFDILIGWGRSRIVANRIMIDYGVNLNLWALTATVFDAPDDNLSQDQLTASSYIPTVSAARVRGVNRFNVFCKVGFLLF